MPGTRSPADPPRLGKSRVRSLVTITLGTALLVLVAFLVAGSRSDGADAWVSLPSLRLYSFADFAIATLFLAGVVSFVLLARAFVFKARTAGPPERLPLWVKLMLLALLVTGAWLFFRLVPREALEFALEEIGFGPFEATDSDVPVDPQRSTAVLLWLAFLSVAGLGWWLIRWTMRADRRLEDLPVAESQAERRRRILVGLLDDAIAALRAHPDPREATIAAWARLEAALDVVGVERAPSDTPTRFLARVLGAVDTSRAAAERLTAAFERAMYSHHPIDRETQLESVDALVAVRDELGVLARSEAPAHA
jgi:hypothetical protein